MSKQPKKESSVLDFILPENCHPKLREQLKDVEQQLKHCQEQLALAKFTVNRWEEQVAGARAQKAILQQQLGESAEQQQLLAKQTRKDEPKTDS